MNAQRVDDPMALRKEIRLLERRLSTAASSLEREPIESELDEHRAKLRAHYAHVRTLRAA